MVSKINKVKWIVWLGVLIMSNLAFANTLTQVELMSNVQEKVEILLDFDGTPVLPKSFSIENPSVLVFDFPGVKNALLKENSSQSFSNNIVTAINVAETDTKTRVSINLVHGVPFSTEIQGNVLRIILDNELQNVVSIDKNMPENIAQIKTFDFRRGERGEGLLVINLSNPKLKIDVQDDNGAIKVVFLGANAGSDLLKKYDVIDFATPVKTVTIANQGKNAEISVAATGGYDLISYQMDNQFVLEIKNSAPTDNELSSDTVAKYTGEKISLNFQDISVRAVLQIIADFSGFNVITDDTVKGNVTLRLQNVPWDQAMDIILRSKGLSKQQYGNVYLVGPIDQMAAREKVELEEKKQLEDLGPMKSELVQVNYATATDIATLIKDKSSSLLTARGTVTVDARTNTLLIQDVAARLNDIKTLLKKLDIPVRQVEISTQIVSSTNTMEELFGARIGGAANLGIGSRRIGVGNNVSTARVVGDYQNGTGQSAVPPSNLTGSGITTQPYGVIGTTTTPPTVSNTEGLFSDLGAGNFSGGTYPKASIASVGLAVARLPNGTLLDLELDALQYESRSKTLARPKLITQDKNKASVEQGIDIPYQQASSSGATSVAFKSASLKLEVTPQITPDDKISLDLNISNDSIGQTTDAGPAINTNRLQTKVLTDNGETVVLGGVLSIIDNKTMGKIPFFGDLPIIGALFRNRYYKYQPQEIIIFITPKIMDPLVGQS